MGNKYSPELRTQRKYTFWIFVALLCALLLNNFAGDYFKKIFFNLLASLTPVFIGFAIAFLLKKLLDFLEKKVFVKWFSKLKHPDKVRRAFSIFLLFVGLFLILYLLITMVVPSIITFINELNSNVNGFVTNIKTQLTEFCESTGWFVDVEVENIITDAIDKIGKTLTDNIPLIAESVGKIIQQTATTLAYLITGIVISILVLYKKEKIATFSKRLTYATFKKSKADNLVRVAHLTDKTLYSYVSAKLIESLIVFVIMLPGLYIFKVPYPIVMALIMAVLNIIPYIGSLFASIIIAIFVIASNTVMAAIYVTIYTIVVLNVYGIFFAPLLFGRRLNVSAILIILSMLLFSSLFGFWGLVLGPPFMVVLWQIINDFIIRRETEEMELSKYDLSREEIDDLEILQEASKIVKQRRKAKQIGAISQSDVIEVNDNTSENSAEKMYGDQNLDNKNPEKDNINNQEENRQTLKTEKENETNISKTKQESKKTVKTKTKNSKNDTK